ncbi:MAG TPA: SdrD B-like domain-containing protein, partial [Thermoanaerobaculia bacterium]
PAKDNLSGGGPFNPGQNVSWRLRVRSAPQSSDPVALQNLVATDLLPVNLVFSSWTFDDQGTGLPAPQTFSQIPNYAGTGRTLLRWTWNAGSGNLGVNQQVWINISTTIRNGAPFGPLSNDFTLDSDAPGLGQRCSGSSQSDPLDLDGDANTAETLCRSTGTINVAPIAQLVSSKTIKGTCDGGAVAVSAGTLNGGSLEYHLRVQNVGTVSMENFVLIDILPFVGDTGVRDTNPRGSQWSPLLAAPIVPPAGTTIYYSTSGNPCRGEVGGPTTSCDPPNWTTVAPTPITSARSFKIEFGDRIVAPFDFLEFTFLMTTPANVTAGLTAYNSFAYQADRSDGLGALAAEPQKVGVSLGSCDAASLGDFVWIDLNGDGIQNDGPTGLNDVYVQLFQPGPDNVPDSLDDVPLGATVTSNGPGGAPGWYTFPGLAPGNYFVRITKPPTFDFSPRDTTADANDSDGNALGSSPVTNLSANENDPTLDFGLVLTQFAALGNYVWFDRNGDGVQNESVYDGANGVNVRLYLDDGDGTREPGGDDPLVGTTVTADDVYARPGYYLFEDLAPGLTYFLQFELPASATGFTTANSTGDTEDSDASLVDGTTVGVVLAPNEFNPTIDAGLVTATGTLSLGDQVWLDADNDGIFEPQNGETGIDDVRLDLYRDANADGEPTLDEFTGSTVTATTSGFAGRYLFPNLAPGNYIVVVAPVNFTGAGALFGLSTSTGNDPAPDPDDDVNGDDNGTDVGALIASHAVTLTDNGEPTSEDGNNDSNLTVDFGFITGAVPPSYDYGDAPDVGAGTSTNDYNTTALDNGPRHLLGVPNAPWLGQCVDNDGGFNQNVAANEDDLVAGGVVSGTCANADDEDGVTFTGSFTPGGTASFSVTAGGPTACSLDAWVDWNHNGVFGDAGEQIATSLNVPTGAPTVLNPSVPAGALPGSTYARFRCSSTGGTTPTGEAANGEVEDYAITIIGTDFGDDPASYGSASHVVDPLVPLYLGPCVDTETAMQSTASADGDDANAGTSRVGTCFDDENGVAFSTALAACMTANVDVNANTASRLDAWIDFNNNGSFADPGEQIFTSQLLAAGINPLSFNVPCTAVGGATYSRFRVTASGGTSASGTGANGEVEDYIVAIGAVDFGDAPDTYGTLLASSGPHHVVVSGYSLGATVDTESQGQPSAGATGDGADEDGVTLPPVFVACS